MDLTAGARLAASAGTFSSRRPPGRVSFVRPSPRLLPGLMFTHHSHLRYLLRPEHYTTEEHHRKELEHLFRPAWHPVATVHQLARPGDFLTFNLFGNPILLRNMDGELCCFLNV